jgi:hypothetical protein
MTTMRRTMMSVGVAVALARPAAAQAPTVATVLERAGAYVVEFEQKLRSIVAEERYIQDWPSLPKGWPLVADRRHRELLSDLLLVKPPSADQWMQFRDVFEVDGAAVRDRSGRLMKLFVEAPPSTDRQIAGILDESARYNIGNISRTVNTPMVALTFLEPRLQSHFRFVVSKDRTPIVAKDSVPAPAKAWVIRYQEGPASTIIRTQNLEDLPSHGRFWVDPETGRVLMTELVAEDRTVRATIDVSYRLDPLLGMLVPADMRERYEGRRNGSRIEGRATYGRFRQFQVNTDETFLIKK